MGAARGRANQKLYHAAVLLKVLRAELAGEDVPATVLMEAIGQPALGHLRESYGWFLLELAGIESLPAEPPQTVETLIRDYALEEPLRGELVELRQLEAAGWMSQLLQPRTVSAGDSARRGGAGLTLVQQDWSAKELEQCHGNLEALMDRMSHGLEEW